jgi:hypothetical protein
MNAKSIWEECADRLVNSSGWHDQWPQAVAHYRKLKETHGCTSAKEQVSKHLEIYNEMVGGDKE